MSNATIPTIHPAPAHTGPIVIGDRDLVVSIYDPTLMGINCFGDCRWTGQGYYVHDWYQRGAACPNGWNGRIVEIPGGHRFKCIDSGGMIVESEDTIIIDILVHHQHWDTFPYDGMARVLKGDWVYSESN